ncbi:MAG: nucleoside recognition domain-containing protein [Deltaproteobacteria bacterium]|nr:nucleoside recognition domain-containing protein [Deltaproteobacteria bacterium]
MNLVFVLIAVVAILVGGITGRMEETTAGAVGGAADAVTLAIGLVGIMALWLGLMKVAEAAGLVNLLARGVRPLMRWLFPEVPEGHPAHAAMVLNIAANMLGLGNAATPLGLKAMQDLQALNDDPETATDAMAMFLAINTSSVQLVPATVIGLRVAAGATHPAEIVLPTLLATMVSTLVAIVAARLLSRLPRFSRARARAEAEAEEGPA